MIAPRRRQVLWTVSEWTQFVMCNFSHQLSTITCLSQLWTSERTSWQPLKSWWISASSTSNRPFKPTPILCMGRYRMWKCNCRLSLRDNSRFSLCTARLPKSTFKGWEMWRVNRLAPLLTWRVLLLAVLMSSLASKLLFMLAMCVDLKYIK